MPELLRTKLYIPPVPPETISRPRLVDRLNQAQSGKLSLIVAPAGYGKTTLVTTWLHQLADRDLVWLSLDESDNDLRRFYSYLVAALNQLDDVFEETQEAHLQDPRGEILPKAIMTDLLNQATAYGKPTVLILDDYHEIEEPQTHEALTFWLDNQPPNFHLVITSRTEPTLPLPRMRVQRQVTEIGIVDLRFTLDESAEFLNHQMHLNLSTDDIAQLDLVTEGWVASLQLAALSLRNKDEPTEFIRTFKGDNRHIVDYLVTEVLRRQPGYIRDFLLQTSILERLNVQLCNAVTEQVGSQHILETLDQARLFVIPLDDQRHWYRYHHLFADCLQAELLRTAPEDLPAYHVRASTWLSNNGFLREATQHAFSANRPDLAADLIAKNAHTLLWVQGETQRPWHWIQQLPDEEVQSRPQLLITKAWLRQELFLDHSPQVTEFLDEATHLIEAADAPYSQPEIANMATEIAQARSNLERLRGQLSQALEHSKQAFDLIQNGDSSLLKTSVHHSLALTYHQVGNIAESLKYSNMRFSSRHRGEPQDYAHDVSLAYHIDALRLAGQLQQAERAAQPLEENQIQRQQSGAAMVAISLAEVLRERNQLECAVDHLISAIEKLKPQHSMNFVVQTGTITLARVYHAQGQRHEATQLLREVLREHPAPDTYYPSARVSATEARLNLQQGNLAAAKAWVTRCGISAEDEPTYSLEIDYLVLARILIADGQVQVAHLLLDKMMQAMIAGGRVSRLIEAQIVQALACKAMGKVELALDLLGQAIELAEPAGFVRIFVDEDAALVPLLKQVAGRGLSIAYIRQLLPLFDESKNPETTMTSAFAMTPSVAHSKADQSSLEQNAPPSDALNLLLNPLTDRELATLRFLASDLSITEIAEQMIVAPSTVRTYVKRIYSKLDVHNRIEAVNRARSLALIG